MSKEKICSTCKVVKDVSCFNKSAISSTGFLSLCKKCVKDNFKRKIDTFEGRLRNLQTSSKTTAKSRGWEYDLDYAQLVELFRGQGGRCALTGDELIPERFNSNTFSIDRIDSSKGYVMNNIQFVTKDVNIAKNKMNMNDFVNLCRKVADLEKL